MFFSGVVEQVGKKDGADLMKEVFRRKVRFNGTA